MPIISTHVNSTSAYAPQLTNGQLMIGNTGTVPSVANITGGNGITVTNGPGSITIGNPTAITWQTSGGGTISPFNGYVTINTANFVLLPTSNIGGIYYIIGGGYAYTVEALAGTQTIWYNESQGNTLTTTDLYAPVTIVCIGTSVLYPSGIFVVTNPNQGISTFSLTT